jgi:hypothetical protein
MSEDDEMMEESKGLSRCLEEWLMSKEERVV